MPEFHDYFNHLESIDPQHEMEVQLKAFYHDAQGGLILAHSFCTDKKKDGGKQTYARTFSDTYQTDCYPVKKNVDTYTALCSFADKRLATNKNGFNRGIFYIDIDCHKAEAAEREQSIRHACEVLNEAYGSGALPIPTLINDTGRGIAIYYIMERFLALKTPNTRKSHWKFQMVYDSLLARYRQVLQTAGCKETEVDGNVKNTARLVRVAGTYNTAAGKKCHLVWHNCDESGNTVYVQNFSDLTEEQEKEKKEKKKGLEKKERVRCPQSTALAMKHRVEAMKALAALRAERGTESYRHTIALITYNAALVCDYERAYDVLCEVNALFACPLSRRELMQIVNTSRRTGGYRFTTQTVRESTGMTPEEETLIQLRKPLSVTKRKRESLERQQKKEELRLQIAKTIFHNPGLTYKEIGELFSMSENTVKRIAKNYQVTRRGNKSQTTDEKLEAEMEIKVSKLALSIGVEVEESPVQPGSQSVEPATARAGQGIGAVCSQSGGIKLCPGATTMPKGEPVTAKSLPVGSILPSKGMPVGTTASSIPQQGEGMSGSKGETMPCRRPVKTRKGKKTAPADVWSGEGLSMTGLFNHYANSDWARNLRGEKTYIFRFG